MEGSKTLAVGKHFTLIEVRIDGNVWILKMMKESKSVLLRMVFHGEALLIISMLTN